MFEIISKREAEALARMTTDDILATLEREAANTQTTEGEK